ncbi:Hypothetical protein I5071_49060 [Sandaracinus amylolyticus]|nr:Hypothetical protein I5071_49060 [Sandaracinus amylolyticus]
MVVSFAAVFALPLLFAPLRWARAFRWEVGPDDRLALYFGRCLGAAALGLLFVIGRGVIDPALTPLALELAAVAGALLGAVHVAGAIQRVQPWTEDAEIVLYALATLGALALRFL